MRKTILTVGIAMLFVIGSATFFGCGNNEIHETENQEHTEGEHHENMEMSEEHADHDQYHCSMGCEGEKTYDEAGSCPKCGMDLTIVAE